MVQHGSGSGSQAVVSSLFTRVLKKKPGRTSCTPFQNLRPELEKNLVGAGLGCGWAGGEAMAHRAEQRRWGVIMWRAGGRNHMLYVSYRWYMAFCVVLCRLSLGKDLINYMGKQGPPPVAFVVKYGCVCSSHLLGLSSIPRAIPEKGQISAS